LSRDVEKGVEAIKQALLDSVLTQEAIDASVLKILRAKQWMELDNYQPTDLNQLYEDLNTPKYTALNHKLTAASITLLRNDNIIPLSTGTEKIAVLSIGSKEVTAFQKANCELCQREIFQFRK